MKYEVTPQGVCPARLEFELDGNVVHNVQFLGGCNGNLQAVSRLVEGLTVDQIKSKLLGTTADSRTLPAPISWHVPSLRPQNRNSRNRKEHFPWDHF